MVNLDAALRYRRPARNVTQSLLAVEQHGTVQRRTPILGPDQAFWRWIPQRIAPPHASRIFRLLKGESVLKYLY